MTCCRGNESFVFVRRFKNASSRLESNSFWALACTPAYHDLEIRGGGNLVGEAQSGHIKAIGYSLYIKMLEEEINKLLNKESFESAKIDLKLSINAFLNSEFIGEDRLRFGAYRRLSKCKEVAEVYEMRARSRIDSAS